MGSALLGGTATTLAAKPARGKAVNRLAAMFPIWQLERPDKPALPNSYFWTWDHSTNWVWDDPGMLNYGCTNSYLKQPGTYLEDYRRLTDMAAGLGVKGAIIWGFLRDSHGGIEYAKRVADYAASRGVVIMPGVGTTWYGGCYYEGNHKYNLETFIKRNPDACHRLENGNCDEHGLCPTHPGFVEWVQKGVNWLFKEFAIGGVNLENGDFVVCYCPRCKERREQWPKDEPLFWFHQYLGYEPALRALKPHCKDKLITWATYKGFMPGSGPGQNQHAYLECARPVMFDKLPADALCQWTLTHMIHPRPLPLSAYLDNGAPTESLSCETWSADAKPPSARSVGFIHQGSQWTGHSRYKQVIGAIKEGCLRAYRAGLEGVSIHGEVSSMHVPWALNYLAFSHFIHWPEDSLRDWGRKTLGQILGSPDEGAAFAELLAHCDAGSLSKTQLEDLKSRNRSLQQDVYKGDHLQRYRFWNWLHGLANNETDPQTVSPF
jgi:hypothetical protein